MIEGLKLRAMLGAGPDGTVYDATRGDRERLIVHLLTSASRKRLRRIRSRADALSLLSTPHLPVVVRDLNGADPMIALQVRGERLIDTLGDDEPVKKEEARRILAGVARALEDAHQLALPHGRISPETVFLDGDDIYLDQCGAETFGPSRFDEAEDVLGLARLARWLTPEGTQAFGALGDAALSEDPSDRPTAAQMRAALERSPERPRSAAPSRVGRFELGKKLGKGAMGEVWSARDLVDGGPVALKLSTHAMSDYHRRRFTKEARLLREIESPYVARLIDFNVYDQPFIALELVEGRSLEARVREDGPAVEDEALRVVADITRGLAAAHARGIVHRDLKPANVMCPATGEVAAKLIDFGIAREIEQSESLAVTEEGALIGTPFYMSPEQASGEPVDTRTDLYALGCVLFFLVVGHPPFRAGSTMAVASKHIFDAPPSLSAEKPELSEGLCELYEHLLEKRADARPASAGEVLERIEVLRGHAAQDIEAHPVALDESKRREYRFEWRLRAPPDALWPLVSDTERINRAIGLDAPKLELQHGAAGVAVFGQLQLAGQKLKWQEHPYEWIEGRRMGILREFTSGPFEWLRSVVELHPDGRGTHLVHTIDLVPRGVVGVAAAALEVGRRAKKNLERVYTRIDGLLVEGRGALDDLYQDADRLSPEAERRFEEREARAAALGAPSTALVKLGDYLRVANPQDLAHLRTRTLARRLGLDEDELLDACLAGAAAELLELGWDLLCPTCRQPSDLKATLRSLEDHGSCTACNLDYELDWSRSIELVFRVHPDLREADAGLYCVGGPGHAPHIAAQVRARPGERFRFKLDLASGRYRLASRWMPFSLVFDVDEDADDKRLEVSLAADPAPTDGYRRLRAGGQEIVVVNESEHEQLVRVERIADREDAITVEAAFARPLFRQLFPGELPSEGRAVRADHVTLFAVDLRAGDDVAAFYESYRAVAEHVRAGGGVLLKVEGAGVLVRFHDPIAAARVARTLPLEAGALSIGVHAGPAHVIAIEQRVDYFGEVPRRAWRLARGASDGEVAVSAEVAANPEIVTLLTDVEGRDLRVVVDDQHVPVDR